MGKYNIGEIWWTTFPFEEMDEDKHRPAVVIAEDTIAVLSLMVTSKNKDNPFYIEITDWKQAGLAVPSWARIDRIVEIAEWRIDEKIGDLSECDLKKIMQLTAEIMQDICHEFSLIAIKDSKNRFLQNYDERWKCWLFPYYRTVEPNKENIDRNVGELVGHQVVTTYVAHATHCKYSVSDDVYKIYNHKLYELTLDEVPSNMEDNIFEIGGVRYSWMSIADMEKNQEIMDKNDDVIAFVKAKCL